MKIQSAEAEIFHVGRQLDTGIHVEAKNRFQREIQVHSSYRNSVVIHSSQTTQRGGRVVSIYTVHRSRISKQGTQQHCINTYNLMEQNSFGNMTHTHLIPGQRIPCFTETRLQTQYSLTMEKFNVLFGLQILNNSSQGV